MTAIRHRQVEDGEADARLAAFARWCPVLPALLVLLLAACGAGGGAAAPAAPADPATDSANAATDRSSAASSNPAAFPSAASDQNAVSTAAQASQAAAALDDPTPLPEPTDPGGAQRRLVICQALQADLAKAVGLGEADLQLRPADVLNPAWGNILDGCRLSWSGPGARLSFGDAATDMPAFKAQRALLRVGWEQDSGPMKDQPGGFVRGFVQGDKLCLLEQRFRPPAGRPCPADDPVTCGLGPADLDYDISLSCAEY